MWIEILKTGTHTAKNGITKTFTEVELDRIARSYNPQLHEAPVAIGDISDRGPAFGWVGKLKREGHKLFAWINQAAPALVDMIQKGTFKKKAVSFYPDYSLRSIVFSDTASSAIAGSCGQYEFNDSYDSANMEFSERVDAQKELNRRILEVLDNPPEYDQFGQKFKWFQPLAEAWSYVLAKNPEIANRLSEQAWKDWVDSVRPFLTTDFSEQADPGVILQRKILEIYLDRGCSYSEAFNDACVENPEIAQRYAETI